MTTFRCKYRRISIHALREEGDRWPTSRPRRRKISIHALREEGDVRAALPVRIPSGFLSTPSARRATLKRTRPRKNLRNFYPRPPRGGRR